MSNWFLPLATTAPTFVAEPVTTGTMFRLETSSTTARLWGSPTNRFIRVTSFSANDVFIQFGSTAAVDVASTTWSMLLLMPGDYIFPVRASQPGISLKPVTAGSTYYVTVGVGV